MENYDVIIKINNEIFEYTCNCPYPGKGCKHIVAVSLDILDRLEIHKTALEAEKDDIADPAGNDLTLEEIKEQAISLRRRALRRMNSRLLQEKHIKANIC